MGDDMIPIYLCEDNTLQLDLLKSMIEKYTKTRKYVEEVAKDKLGLVYDGEIIFKPEN